MSDAAFAGLAFTRELLSRPTVSSFDVEATLQHFAIVSYAIPPERVLPHIDPAFDLDCFTGSSGQPLVWVSMVPFEDQDFRFVCARWLKFRFGQTNYRTYVIHRDTGKRAVWFFGTTLDSWTVSIPRHLWKLPWHRGHVRFDCAYDPDSRKYTRYRMTTTSDWAPVEIDLEDLGTPVTTLNGLNNFDAAMVVLTHPLLGVFHCRDGRLGTYHIWHDRLQCTEGRVNSARIGLFDRLGLVPYAEQSKPHSVLIQNRTEFTIYLPPRLMNAPH